METIVQEPKQAPEISGLLGPRENHPEDIDLRSLDNSVNHEDFIDGYKIDYWTHDAAEVLDKAIVRAKDIYDQQPDATKRPIWVNRVIDHLPDVRKEAITFDAVLNRDTKAILDGEVTPGSKTPTDSIERWYRSLGPTNEDQGLSTTLLKMTEVLEKQPDTPKRNLIMGNMIQDVAYKTDFLPKKAELLLRARKIYKDIELSGDLSTYETRAAMRHRIDIEHEILSIQYSRGDADLDKFYEAYERLQKESATAFKAALNVNKDMSFRDGELAEWGSLLFLRHYLWANQEAEDYSVRAALLREDQAIYPWRVEMGMNPIWSFDTVLTKLSTPNQPVRIQLKNGNIPAYDQRSRVYVPGVARLVTLKKDPQQLRELAKRAAEAIPYSIDTSHDPNLSLTPDEGALSEVSGLFIEALKP